ncbi:hypothetical protein WAI453_013299 [Rhynchosporium graminicola]
MWPQTALLDLPNQGIGRQAGLGRAKETLRTCSVKDVSNTASQAAYAQCGIGLLTSGGRTASPGRGMQATEFSVRIR